MTTAAPPVSRVARDLARLADLTRDLLRVAALPVGDPARVVWVARKDALLAERDARR